MSAAQTIPTDRLTTCSLLTRPSTVQTDVKTEITPEIKSSSAEPTVQDFLARERAILGDDANQFATVEDAGLDEDLLGAGSSNVLFESKFPDISVPEVRALRLAACFCFSTALLAC